MKDVISDDNFKEEIARGLSLVDFNAPWCAPCRMQEPILEKLSKQYQGRVRIAAMNIDENKNTAQLFGIRSIPTLIIFKKGKEIQRFVGLQSEGTLSDSLNQHLD